MILSGITIFLSAFLLFLVQPILAKLILPRFGGGAAIWATCLVFFQAAMLLGYAYAHQLIRQHAVAKFRVAHIVLLLASLATLPIIPSQAWRASAGSSPSIEILGLLVVTIGLPFTLLATTSPLLQAWLARGRARRNPYRLFAVSNLASLGALVSYPWLIEPWLKTATQAMVWSVAYAIYVVLVCLVSISTFSGTAASEGGAPARHDINSGAGDAPQWSRLVSWVVLAALASYELVAVTNHLTQNIPSFPMMWILPLVIYLLSFVMCFDADRWYSPRAFQVAALLAIAAMSWILYDERFAHSIAWHAITFLVGLFVVCMYCHGELVLSRPHPNHLTGFYLCAAAGGVLGGAIVGLGAPALLPGYFEVELGLVLLSMAFLWRAWKRSRIWSAVGALTLLSTGAIAGLRINEATGDVVDMSRNFYGVVTIREYGSADEPDTFERILNHGSIMHGEQYLAEDRKRRPSSYYTESSGVGLLLQANADRKIEVGIVGLGAGTIAAYGKPGDVYRFYEIDPAVVAAAKKYFTYIADSSAKVDVVVGDGRLSLQDERPHRFDVLVIDAFSGDSIPVHLLTREAVMLYRDRITPSGVIALHVSNRFLDLRPVVSQIAADLGLQLAYVEDFESDDAPEKASSDWMLLAMDNVLFDKPNIKGRTTAMPKSEPREAWTDEYSNIVQVMSFAKALAID